jgi:glycosidase
MMPFTTPVWMHGAVMYQIFPERFFNGDPSNDPAGTVPWGTPPASHQFQGGDLNGITQKVDYLHDLGVEVLYLNPIFTSPSTHKYDCSDYYNVDPAFGGNDALLELVSALHQRDMKVILDASFNHCHPNFFAFRDIIQHGEASRYWDWFTIYEHPITVKVRPHKVPPEHQDRLAYYKTWIEKAEQDTGIPMIYPQDDGPVIEPSYDSWMNVFTMPKINLSNPETRTYFLDMTRYWIEEFDIDGWRMDVVPFVVPDFWAEFRRVAKAVKPDVVLLAEIWGNGSFWLQGEGFDGTMNYTLRTLALEYFAYKKMSPRAFLDGCVDMLMMYAGDITQVGQNLLSSHDTERFLHEAGDDLKRLRLATFFQMTMPGSPSIYYGDEVGVTGGHDPDCRRAFPWDQPDEWDMEMQALVKTLAKLRKVYPALKTGDWKKVWQSEEALAYLRFEKEHRVLVVINRDAAIGNIVIPLELKDKPTLLLGNVEFEPVEEGILIREQGPWSGSLILV